MEPMNKTNKTSIQKLSGELDNLFGQSLANWQLLRIYRLPFHQPSQSRDLRATSVRSSGVYLCGDHLAEPTLDSAMRSGRRAAEEVVKAGKAVSRRTTVMESLDMAYVFL